MRLSLLLLLAACGPKDTPVETAVDHRTQLPEPLEPRAFQVPEASSTTLSSGLAVHVVENHEVPLVYVRLDLDRGGLTDPADRPGLAHVTMDMLNEGVQGMDAAALSNALRKLGSSLNTWAGQDGSTVFASSLSSRLPETLDLMAKVVFEPTFPDKDWEINRNKRLQDLRAEREHPDAIARRVALHSAYGDHYAGRLRTEAAYQAMTPDEMRAWYADHVVPAAAVLLVGGDTTLDEVLPLLEARFGSWAAEGAPAPVIPSFDALPAHVGSTIFLVDKPGAPQSVVRGGLFVGARTDADHTAFQLANRVLGGQFSARINMTLREEKGWTYGARSYASYNHLPGLWTVSSSVVAEHTADTVAEILRELTEAQGEHPITEAELTAARDGWLGSWPLDFEQPNHLLGEINEMRRYGLADDWITGFPGRVRGVDLAAAQAAWVAHVDPAEVDFVVVGDAASSREALEALGLPVVLLDADGNPVE